MSLKCALLCFLILLITAVLAISVSADDSQSYGEEKGSFDVSADEKSSVTVKIYKQSGENRLVVSGEGEMREFSSADEIPWHEYSDSIVSVTVEKGVKNLSKFFFHGCTSLNEVWIYEAHLILIADKQYIPYTSKIYGHFNSTARIYVFENYPSRFFTICDFLDSVCSECGFECENHGGGEPTCTEGGKCEVCGAEYIASVGHRLSLLVPEVPATCYSSGMSAHYICLSCDAIFDENGRLTTEDALRLTTGHSYGELVEYVPPTCTLGGSVAHYECSFCHKIFDENEEKIDEAFLSPTGHRGGVATCLSGAICEICNSVYTEVDSANHSYGEEIKYSQSTHWRECFCGGKTDVSAHSLSDKTVKEPTEEEMGILESSCICGYKTSKFIPKLAPSVNDNPESEIVFSTLKLIILILASVLLCASVTAIVIIIRKNLKG